MPRLGLPIFIGARFAWRETIVSHRKGKFDAVSDLGHHFFLVLFAPLNSTASESFRGRCVDVVQFHFQESLGDDQRAHGRTNVTAHAAIT